MTTEEIEDGLASLGTEHPFRRALVALLEENVRDEQGSATKPDLADGARHFNAGRLAHAIDVKGLVEDYMKRGQERIERARQVMPRNVG